MLIEIEFYRDRELIEIEIEILITQDKVERYRIISKEI